MGITKTDYIRGMQCPRMLWLDKHHPEYKVIPPFVQKRMDVGNDFGDKAMGLFGPYVEVQEYYPGTKHPIKEKMVEKTKELLSANTRVICEAAFQYDDSYCAVDILRKKSDSYEIYEVKDSAAVTEQHIKDISFQSYIILKSGLKLSKICVIHHGGDEDNPYEIVDVTKEALKQTESISNNIERLNTIAAEQEEVKYEPGEQCDNPYVCWYKQYCGQIKE